MKLALVAICTVACSATPPDSYDDTIFTTGEAPKCFIDANGATVVHYSPIRHSHTSFKCTHGTDGDGLPACTCSGQHPTHHATNCKEFDHTDGTTHVASGDCENQCDGVTCSNGGTCVDGNNGYTCDCSAVAYESDPGNSDPNCDSPTACTTDDITCQNGGTVTGYRHSGCSCDCTAVNYEGDNCETASTPTAFACPSLNLRNTHASEIDRTGDNWANGNTLEYWALVQNGFATANGEGRNTIFGYCNNGGADVSCNTVGIRTDRQTEAYHYSSNMQTGGYLTNNAWAHVAMTYAHDGTATTYVNGVNKGTGITGATPSSTGTGWPQTMWVCHDVWGANRNYIGQIGGIRVSNTIRYTSDFTPSPTLTHDANTLLSVLPDSSNSNGYTITFA